jgi:hypothetical protein
MNNNPDGIPTGSLVLPTPPPDGGHRDTSPDRRWLTRATWFALLISAIPLAFLVGCIAKYSVNIPYWDQWDVVPLFDHYYSHALSFQDVWRQHNEHRLVLPNLIFLGLGLLTHFNVRFEMALAVVIALLSYALIVRHACKAEEAHGLQPSFRYFWAILSVYLFSLGQWENWLWGFQIQWFLVVCFVICGAYVLANWRLNGRALVALSLLGILATFSLSAGIAFWPLVFFALGLIVLKERPARAVWLLAAWALVSTAIVALYLLTYQKPAHHPQYALSLGSLPGLLSYVFVYLGTPLTMGVHQLNMARLVGAVGVVVLAALVVDGAVRQAPAIFRVRLFFLMLGCFAVAAAIITGIGRAGFGLAQAMASRYTSISVLLWVAIVFELYVYGVDRRTSGNALEAVGRWGARCLVIGLVCVGVLRSVTSLEEARQWQAKLACGAEAAFYGVGSSCLGYLYPVPTAVVDLHLPVLERHGLSLFVNGVPRLALRIPSDGWLRDGSWTLGGVPGVASPVKTRDERYFFGSWSGDDRHKGELTSPPVRVGGRWKLVLFISHGPSLGGQRVGVRIGGAAGVEVLCDLSFPAHEWRSCTVDLAGHVGEEMTIFAEDEGDGWGEWCGVYEPVIVEQ